MEAWRSPHRREGAGCLLLPAAPGRWGRQAVSQLEVQGRPRVRLHMAGSRWGPCCSSPGDGGAGHALAQWPSLPVPGLCHPGNGATELAVTQEPGTQVLAEGPWAQSGRLIHLSLCVICLPSS